jgi:hypothetical protein
MPVMRLFPCRLVETIFCSHNFFSLIESNRKCQCRLSTSTVCCASTKITGKIYLDCNFVTCLFCKENRTTIFKKYFPFSERLSGFLAQQTADSDAIPLALGNDKPIAVKESYIAEPGHAVQYSAPVIKSGKEFLWRNTKISLKIFNNT